MIAENGLQRCFGSGVQGWRGCRGLKTRQPHFILLARTSFDMTSH